MLMTIVMACCFATSGAQTCHETVTTSRTITECEATAAQGQGPVTVVRQGSPGKRGPEGPRGAKGEKGEECDGDKIETKLDKIKRDFNRKLEILSGYRRCLAGMQSGAIANDQIQASSFWHTRTDVTSHHYTQARLDKASHTWEPLRVKDSWIGVDLLRPTSVQGVVLQGRHLRSDKWLTSFKVSYGDDQDALSFVSDDVGTAKIFPGCWDRDSHVVTIFPDEIRARYVRIHPVTWQGSPNLRFDLITCH